MNYLTGLALGVSAGHKLHQLLQGGGFTLVHALPARRRYRHDDLLDNRELALQWEQHLRQIQGITQVKITPETGSILLLYTCRDEYLDLVIDDLSRRHKMPGPRAGYGRLGMNIRGLGRQVNRNIVKNTDQLLDLRTILAGLMFVSGAAKMWTLGQRPSGPQMVWWAYSLLKGRY